MEMAQAGATEEEEDDFGKDGTCLSTNAGLCCCQLERAWLMQGESTKRNAGPGMRRRRGAASRKRDVVLFPQDTKLELENAVRIICCVDDTDDLTGDTSTGYVAECIAGCAIELGGKISLGITRHQLLLADDIAYTSHNSAMCLAAYLPRGTEEAFAKRAVSAIIENSAASADPGLCIAHLDQETYLQDVTKLCEFGQRAQNVLCTKEEAYSIAETIPWVSLSEHGGTGDGVIGALAGAGLRLSGNDGRFRGKWDLQHITGFTDEAVSAEDLCRVLSRKTCGDVIVIDVTGKPVSSDTPIKLVREAKPVLYGVALALVVEKRDGIFVPSEKVDLGTIGNTLEWDRVCDRFQPDNDVEECDPVFNIQRSCRNCLYRRWTKRGFYCAVS